jgi:hypothetical protein
MELRSHLTITLRVKGFVHQVQVDARTASATGTAT